MSCKDVTETTESEEVATLRARIDELQAEAEKKKHGHAGALRELENTRSRLSLAEKRIEELEQLRAELDLSRQTVKEMIEAASQRLPKPQPEPNAQDEPQPGVAQFSELERLRMFAEHVERAHRSGQTMSDVVDSVSDALDLLGRASPAQAEPQSAQWPQVEEYVWTNCLNDYGRSLSTTCTCKPFRIGVTKVDGDRFWVGEHAVPRFFEDIGKTWWWEEPKDRDEKPIQDAQGVAVCAK